MTAPEPLTLVELVRHLGEHDYWLGYDSSGMYIAMPVDGNSPAACGTGSTPWEAASDAMPERQVAPRDEAAELRAALREWSEANRACSQWVAGTVGNDQDELTLARLIRAERHLHALATSEGQP